MAVIDGANLTGTPPADFNGTFDIVLTASDGTLEATDSFRLTISAVNDAPIVSIALADQTSEEDAAISIALPGDSFTDVDGDALTLTATLVNGDDLPSWLSFDGSAFTGTPPANFNGELDIRVTASDGELTVSDDFRLSITAVNDAPIAGIALLDQNFDEDSAISFGIPADAFTDIDGDALTLSATLANGDALPEWLSFDGSDFTGTPPADFNGQFTLTVTATDGEYIASQQFNLIIDPVNDAPVLVTALADVEAAEDSAISIDLPAGSFADIDGDALSLSATLADGSDLPAWLDFDGSSFTGTPPANFNGEINIEVTASDGELTASDIFRLTITPVNDAPVAAIALADETVAKTMRSTSSCLRTASLTWMVMP